MMLFSFSPCEQGCRLGNTKNIFPATYFCPAVSFFILDCKYKPYIVVDSKCNLKSGLAIGKFGYYKCSRSH